MTAYSRRSFSGDAADSTISSSIDSTSLSVTCTDLTDWPDGTGGNFVVILEPDTDNEEHVVCSSRTGNTLAIVSRGVDDTTAVGHSSMATVRHGLSKVDVDEANYAVSQTVGQIAAKGDLLVGSAANTLTKVGVGTDGQVLTVAAGTWSAADLPADLVTTDGTQTLTGKTLTSPTVNAPTIAGYTEATGSATTFDATAKNVWTYTLTANLSPALTAGASGSSWSLSVIFTQDATGGRVVTWPASVKWPNGVAPSPDTTANAVNIYTLVTVDGGTTWYGFLAGRGMK